jgi:hypothetical protein
VPEELLKPFDLHEKLFTRGFSLSKVNAHEEEPISKILQLSFLHLGSLSKIQKFSYDVIYIPKVL